MTTADWAIVISLGSLTISVVGFIWNVWSKFIYPKPRVETSISIMKPMGPGWDNAPSAVCISATNHGPAEVTLHTVVARKRWNRVFGRRRNQIGILNPYRDFPHDLDTDGPFSAGLPKRLVVGEMVSFYFPISKDWFQKDKLVDFGVHDTFGRNHWAKKRQVSNFRERVLSDFSELRTEQ